MLASISTSPPTPDVVATIATRSTVGSALASPSTNVRADASSSSRSVSELANSSGELPPAKSIFEQAREEKEAEIEAKAKAAELDDEENERTEPTGEFASTISALDRLTAAIDEKLEAKDRSQKK
ncbi:hypothetical protein N9M16_09085 [Candidatus Dependentiae bacterium]|nr:hypothetical protein [Candidatus Dependentiae bacterium]